MNFLFLIFLGAAGEFPMKNSAVAFSTDHAEKNIIGKFTCPKNAISYQVSLNYGYDFCSGTLINKEWVLTAAECLIMEVTTNPIPVFRFTWVNTTLMAQRDVKKIGVKYIFIHPSYNKQTYENNIIMIKLKRPATIYSQVSTISLQKTCPPVGTQCLVSGWGNTVSNGSATLNTCGKYENTTTGKPSLFQCVDTSVLSTSSCNKFYLYDISPNIFCLGSQGDINKSFQDEIGSPAVCNGKLQGITTSGRGRFLKNKVHLYAKVCRHVIWIQSTMSCFMKV